MSANQKKRGENMLSVIIPAYNEEKMIQTTADTVDRILSAASVPYEIVFVNDGSKDGTWQQIETAAEKNPHVNGLHFSRNFGKEAAMYAGLQHARGEYVAIMDADLQHPPAMLKEMYEGLQSEEYDCVAARRESDQMTLGALGEGEVLDAIRRCQPDTLTPIEAMSLIYEWKQKLQ